MVRLLIFALAFAAPMFYWRSLFYIAARSFDKPFTRTKTGLQVHHLHYGALLVLIAGFVAVLGGLNTITVISLGLGLGLIFDEFIASLLMPGNRPLELEIYKKSLPYTIYLFLMIVVIFLLLGFLIYGF